MLPTLGGLGRDLVIGTFGAATLPFRARRAWALGFRAYLLKELPEAQNSKVRV